MSNVNIKSVGSIKTWEGDIMQENSNFEERFKSLGEFYMMDSPDEIRNQISKNENIFIYLEKVKPYLKQSFSEAEYVLEMNYEPELDDRFIILRVDVSEERFNNGIGDEIRLLDSKLWDLEKELDIVREVLIMPGILDV